MNKTINSSMRTSVRRGEMKMEIEKGQYIEEPWEIIQSYFRDRHLDRLVRHQLESYNNFVTQQIPKTIEMFNPVRIASENNFDAASGKYALEIFVNFEFDYMVNFLSHLPLHL